MNPNDKLRDEIAKDMATGAKHAALWLQSEDGPVGITAPFVARAIDRYRTQLHELDTELWGGFNDGIQSAAEEVLDLAEAEDTYDRANWERSIRERMEPAFMALIERLNESVPFNESEEEIDELKEQLKRVRAEVQELRDASRAQIGVMQEQLADAKAEAWEAFGRHMKALNAAVAAVFKDLEAP